VTASRLGAIDADVPPPPPPPRSERVTQIVAAARRVLEDEGAEAVTMRRIGEELAIRGPSLYKHVTGKARIELLLVEDALAELGTILRAAVHGLAPSEAVAPLFAAYRSAARAHPNLYRLATVGPIRREELPDGLEDWAGEPFLLTLGEPYLAQAAWSAAHGMVILELDDRYPPDSELDRTWEAAVEAFGDRISRR
jgi:AcrR family transcriptional regulator